MTDFTNRIRDYISLRRIDVQLYESEAQDLLEKADRINADLDKLAEALDLLDQKTSPSPIDKPKRPYAPRPNRRKYPFYDMKIGDQCTIENVARKTVNSSLGNAREATGFEFMSRLIERDGVPMVVVSRIA